MNEMQVDHGAPGGSSGHRTRISRSRKSRSQACAAAQRVRLAFFDIRKCFRLDGSLKPVPELDDETAYALRSMDTKEAYRHFGRGKAKAVGVIEKIRMADKGLNLERLGRARSRCSKTG